MNGLLDKLIDILEEEINIFRSLFGILEDETAALMISDVKQLNEVIKKKENEVLKIRLLETQREKMVHDIAEKLGCSPKGLTLSQLAGMADIPYSQAIFKINEKLSQFAHSIRLLNQKNQTLLQQSLGLVRDSLSMLDGLLYPGPVYHNNGKFAQTYNQSGRLVSGII